MGDVGYARFVRSDVLPGDPEQRVVDDLASSLLAHLRRSAVAVDAVHVYGARSSAIQSIVSQLLTEHLGFAEEVVLTPQDGLVTQSRPDFFYRLAPGRGILAEVERGGTTNNNHDLKDVWKAHVSPDAQHLFLVVPNTNWKASGEPRERPFHRVVGRVQALFGEARREVDIRSAHVFGYGRED